MSTIKSINMSSETMASLKADMDDMITKTLDSMQVAHCGEATISVKLKISLEKVPVTNEKEYRDALRPKFDHTVTTSVQIKDQKKGTTSGDYEMYRDPDSGKWCMKDIKSQISMFEEPIDMDDDLKDLEEEE